MKKQNTQSGFTLIEMAVVMMIFGIAVVAGLKLYENYMTHQRTVTTSSNVSLSSRSVSDFRARFGRYPCPASLSAARGSPEYGREGDCNANGLARDGVTAGDEAPVNNGAAGTFADGYYVEQSARMVDTDGDSVGDLRPMVARGAVPFRDLNLPEEFAYDGYGQRIVYAVTERLAAQDTFNPRQGGIAIVDTQSPPQSLIETPDSGLFIVMSAGADGDGAYSRQGVLIQACPTGSDIEKENCDISTTEAKYVHINRQGTFDASAFDDNLAYYSGVEDSLWAIAEADPDDIILRQDGRVNVNVKDAASTLPSDSLFVSGVIRASDDYLAQQICADDGTDCFTTDKIGGALADGGGMECPPGQYLQGISLAAPICANAPAVSDLRCPAGQYMIGMDTDGTLKCSASPERCVPEDRTICGATQTLPYGLVNVQHTLVGGVSRTERYKCKKGSDQILRWQANPNLVTGVCACNPADVLNQVGGCGTGYTGTRPYTQTRQCPAGNWGPVVYTNGFNTDCTCVGYTEYRDTSCGAGFNVGVLREKRVWTCDGSNNLVNAGWVVDVSNPNPCTCVEQNISETNIACSGGLEGTYSRTNHLSCPSATWDGWAYDYSGCSCNSGKTRTRVVSCPSPQLGAITEQDTYTCTSATTGYWNDTWVETSNTCATPPPTICVWKPVGTPVQVNTQPNVPRAGKECSCGSASGACYEYGDPNYLKYNLCTCE